MSSSLRNEGFHVCSCLASSLSAAFAQAVDCKGQQEQSTDTGSNEIRNHIGFITGAHNFIHHIIGAGSGGAGSAAASVAVVFPDVWPPPQPASSARHAAMSNAMMIFFI